MWRILLGFGIGIYVSTYYDCKPTLEHIIDTIKKNLPKNK